MDIEYRENCLSPEDFIRLRIAVGRVSIPLPQAEAALRAGLYENWDLKQGRMIIAVRV